MKKSLVFLALISVLVVSCKRDETNTEVTPEVSIETQNSYDDEAAQNFLATHYFDVKGNVKELAATDTVNVKLSLLNPITLPSGVVYVSRPTAQPSPGTAVGTYDKISLMSIATSYVATKTDAKVSFNSPSIFRNTISFTGVPEIDPMYYYVKKSVLENATMDVAKQRSFYEIEGFQEALKKFNSFDQPDETNYNFQGLIIVPSRAAFARDQHYNYTGVSYRNRSFIFSFQLYKTVHFTEPR